MKRGQRIVEDICILAGGICFVMAMAAMILYEILTWPIDAMRGKE